MALLLNIILFIPLILFEILERPPREAITSSESDECESGNGTHPSYQNERDYARAKSHAPLQHYGSFYLRMGAVGKWPVSFGSFIL